MLEDQKLAIAAHLHVLLRRKTGRVTDMEWMATNAEYAREIARFSVSKGKELGAADLQDWGLKLQTAYSVIHNAPAKPLITAARDALREHTAERLAAAQHASVVNTNEIKFSQSGFEESGFMRSAFGNLGAPMPSHDTDAPRYIGGLR